MNILFHCYGQKSPVNCSNQKTKNQLLIQPELLCNFTRNIIPIEYVNLPLNYLTVRSYSLLFIRHSYL